MLPRANSFRIVRHWI